jgi:hypothetical protein
MIRTEKPEQTGRTQRGPVRWTDRSVSERAWILANTACGDMSLEAIVRRAEEIREVLQ